MLVKRNSCPICGSHNMTYTAEVSIGFTVDENGKIVISSTTEELVKEIIHEWNDGRIYIECHRCSGKGGDNK